MAVVRVLVLRGPGVNCDEETAFAWERAGASAERVHVNALIQNPEILLGYQVLTLPGGFSYGDHVAAGRILAHRIEHHLMASIHRLLESGGLILGICNGFQALLRCGLLTGAEFRGRISLTTNSEGRFVDRWVRVQVTTSRSFFLRPDETFELPIAHAEGRFAAGDENVLSMLKTRDRVALEYVGLVPEPADGEEVPGGRSGGHLPNGSIGNVAGLTDETGQILGLMPHPERAIEAMLHPLWTRDASIAGDGLRVFQRAVAHLA